jgi:hypothetical protein
MAITVRVSRSSGCNEWTKPQKEPPMGRMGSLTHCWFRKFGWTHVFLHIANASCLLCTTYRAHQKCWYDQISTSFLNMIWSTYLIHVFWIWHKKWWIWPPTEMIISRVKEISHTCAHPVQSSFHWRTCARCILGYTCKPSDSTRLFML